MPEPKMSILFFILLLTTTTLLPTSTDAKDPILVYTLCITTVGNYTANSFYQKNLNSVLSDLSSQSSSLYFSNSSTGTSPNDVYGLFYCRYDLPSSTCSACVKAAMSEITSNCTTEKEAISWYDDCTLRYANRNIFSLEEDSAFSYSVSKTNVSMNLTLFNELFSDAVASAISNASYNSSASKKYFATSVTKLSSVDTLYVLVQCTPDIDADSCSRCLKTTVRDLPFRGKNFALFFRPSCQMRYDLAPFFEVSAPTPPSSSTPSSSSSSKGVVVIGVVAGVVGLLLVVGIVVFLMIRRRRKRGRGSTVYQGVGRGPEVEAKDQCVQFEFKTLETATSKFSLANKLGQGGFGIVYRGALQNGQHLAVKRLSKVGGQGAKEFKTEIEVVAQLQHRNLVRLIGYCVEGDERLVVYEYLPNLSLDNFLFGSAKAASLTWAIRYKIIVGIARGLHYLHEDSRIKIVHRDLKTSNILLDDNLDPKIADFGMATLMQVDQTQAHTTRVVGTFGYIAPEYALAGRCTPKSDIYSFGVIILEILSGKSCIKFYQKSHEEGLLRYAWRVWSEDVFEQLMDPILQNNYSRNEVERCIRIGLLCVQDDETNRPTMQALLMMLSSNSVDVPSPFPPATFSNSIGMPSEGGDPGGESSNQETDPGRTNDSWYMENDLYAR